MYKKAILCAVLGGLGGIVAFLIARPYLSDVAAQNVHPDFTLGSTFGWLSHALLGAFIAGSIASVLGYNDWGIRGAWICGSIGLVLGAFAGYGSDAFYDWLLIRANPMIRIGFEWHVLWSMFVSTALAVAIFLSTGAKGHRLMKCIVAAGASTLLGTMARQAVGSTIATGMVLNALNNPSSLARANRWEAAGPGMMAEFCVMGIVLGGVFGLVEAVMKSVRFRQILGRNEWRSWSLGDATYRVGSAEDSEIRVSDGQLAPLHAYVMRQNGQFCVQEANGALLVNGMATPAHWLSEGDVIQLGSATFLFGEGDVPTAGAGVVPELRPVASRTADHRLTDGFGNVYSLKPGVYVIGRDEAADIALTWDQKSSRRHAEISVSPDGVTITDLGSTNGTTVDGNAVSSPVLLLSGAKVQVGSTILTYHS